MTRINTVGSTHALFEWIQKNQEEIKGHPAWHGNISEQDAETLLKGQNPFTYVLRSEGKENSYFISFVREDLSIKHQFFVLEPSRKGWQYRNGCVTSLPTEIISQNLNELIPLMMHCDPHSCNFIRA